MGTAAHFNPSFGVGVAEDGDLAARHEKLSGTTTRAYFADELVKSCIPLPLTLPPPLPLTPTLSLTPTLTLTQTR